MEDTEKLNLFNKENNTKIELRTKNISLSNISLKNEFSLKNLFSISFPDLISITLNNISLTNLSFLSSNNFPLLKFLFLDRNNLINLEGISLLNSKNLEERSYPSVITKLNQ